MNIDSYLSPSPVRFLRVYIKHLQIGMLQNRKVLVNGVDVCYDGLCLGVNLANTTLLFMERILGGLQFCLAMELAVPA